MPRISAYTPGYGFADGAGFGDHPDDDGWGAGSGAMNQHTNGHGASESDPTHFYDAYIGRPFTQPPWGIAR